MFVSFTIIFQRAERSTAEPSEAGRRAEKENRNNFLYLSGSLAFCVISPSTIHVCAAVPFCFCSASSFYRIVSVSWPFLGICANRDATCAARCVSELRSKMQLGAGQALRGSASFAFTPSRRTKRQQIARCVCAVHVFSPAPASVRRTHTISSRLVTNARNDRHRHSTAAEAE